MHKSDRQARINALDVDKAQDRALGFFENGYNCAETVVAAFVVEMGLDMDAIALSTPFGAGISGRRDLCGMLTGGAMIIGLLYGRTDPADMVRKQDSYVRASQYYRWFKTERQTKCADIVTGRFTGHTDVCVQLMSDATEKLIEIIKAPGA